MKTLAARLEPLWDSPTLPKDLSSFLSAWRIGAWFLLLNGVLGPLMTFMIVMSSIENTEPFVTISQQLGLGQYMGVSLMLGIGAVLTVMMPLRACGLFEGPRWGKYFDQLVLSGMSPERYIAGRVVSQNIFFGLILVASLPYAVFGLSMGGTRVTFVLGGLFTLWIYANVLSLFTLAMSSIVHETAAVLLVISTSGMFYILGLFPVSAFGLLTPSHYLCEPFHDALVGGGRPGFSEFLFTVEIGGQIHRISSFWLFLITGSLVAFSSLVFSVIGPVKCLVKENSTFGEVVMSGDTKRKRMFRMRFMMRRKSELAFFYENRSPLLTKWELPLRYIPTSALIGMLVLTAFGIAHYYSYEARVDEFRTINLVIFSCSILLASVVFCSDRMTETTLLRCGPFALTKGAADLVAFICFSAFAWIIAYWGTPLREYWELQDLAKSGMTTEAFSWLRTTSDRVIEKTERIVSIYPMFLLLGFEVYALIRLLGCQFWDRSGAFAVTVIFLFAQFTVTFGVPLIFFSNRDLKPYAEYVAFISVASPIPYCIESVETTLRGEIGQLIETGWYALTPAYHVLLAITLAAWAFHLHHKLVRARRRETVKRSVSVMVNTGGDTA